MVFNDTMYKQLAEAAPCMLWRTGPDSLCDYFNTTWLTFTGRTLAQEIGDGWTSGVHPDDLENYLKQYLAAFDKKEPFESVYRLRRADGEWRWVHVTAKPLYDSNIFVGYVGSCLDVTEQILTDTWKAMAQRDGLTGVYNHYFFDLEARKLFTEIQRQRRQMCLLVFDIDRFKALNDRFGNAFGDKILILFVSILKDNIRDTDLLGRCCDDEFVLMLPQTSRRDAGFIVSRITSKLKHLSGSAVVDGVSVSFSHGIAELEPGDTYEQFLERADTKMNEEKKTKIK